MDQAVVKTCPKCGSTYITTTQYGERDTWVRCNDCGWGGPVINDPAKMERRDFIDV